jgi:glycosyltransferase involved in cell wall biosynthesis
MTNGIRGGVSVIVCCYNSASRIEKTLHALSLQKVPHGLNWEVLIVDNASSDNTADLAVVYWENLGRKTTLRVVYEGEPGLANARNKGITEAKYELLVFCDDDNRLDPLYILNAATIFETNSKLAACGGLGRPVFETPPPFWFNDYQEAFAVGPQDQWKETNRILHLYGAGLAVSKTLLQLYNKGFEPLMTGRQGSKLSSSEDTELTNAFVLAGYELGYSNQLTFEHSLTKERLTFSYLKKLFTAFGTDGPVRNMYYSLITAHSTHKKINNWYFHFMLSVFRLVKYFIIPPKRHGRMIYVRWSFAYIRELLRIKPFYNTLYKKMKLLQATAGATVKSDLTIIRSTEPVKAVKQ